MLIASTYCAGPIAKTYELISEAVKDPSSLSSPERLERALTEMGECVESSARYVKACDREKAKMTRSCGDFDAAEARIEKAMQGGSELEVLNILNSFPHEGSAGYSRCQEDMTEYMKCTVPPEVESMESESFGQLMAIQMFLMETLQMAQAEGRI